MDLRAISALLLKIAGLVLIAHAITRAPSLFAYAARENWAAREVLIMAGLGIGPQLMLGLLFWFFPSTIANKVVAGPPSGGNSEFREIQLIALAVLGVFLIANSLIDAAQLIATVITFNRESPDVPLSPLVPRVVGAVVGLLIGLGICLGRVGLSVQIDKLRGRES
jgi:hypothetical protein